MLSTLIAVSFFGKKEESCAQTPELKYIDKKKLNIAFTVQECDANEVDLYSAAGLIKNKNKLIC
jgi:hypothetical protein